MDNRRSVEISGLTVRFGAFTAVDGVSFTVERGRIFGFLGANGAGKTTTIRVMCGILAPDAGTVRIAGLTFGREGGTAIKERVGYMSQKFTLYDDLTVEENMAFKASLRRMPDDVALRRREELLSFIGFTWPLSTLVRDLPSGVKQQISLAASLLHQPDIIFLDEPTSGVSPAVRARFWSLIRRLAGEGRTVIVTTHYMDEAEQCEEIALMRAGRLIALDSPAGLKRSAYPETLLEIIVPAHAGSTASSLLINDPAVQKAWPHGMRYHAVLRGDARVEDLAGRLPRGWSARAITPSLEDVFVRLVEGADR